MRTGYEKTPKTVKINLADFQTLIFDCMHWHKHIEICKMVKGKCDFLISGKTHTANEGDILVLAPEINKFQFGYSEINTTLWQIFEGAYDAFSCVDIRG